MGIKISAIILAIMSVLSFLVINHLNDSYTDIAYSYDIVKTIEQCRWLLTDAQSSIRAYVITEDKSLLMAYNQNSPKVMSIIDKIEKMTKNNKNQQVHVDKMRLEASNKLNIMRTILNFAEHGNEFREAQIKAASYESEQIMIKFREACEAISSEEYKSLVTRQNGVNRSYAYAYYGMPSLIVLSAVVLTIAHYRGSVVG